LLFFVALAAMLVWRPPGSRLVLALTVVAPFVLAISPLSSYTAQPRYLLFLLPAVTLLIGTLLSRAWPWLAIAALCAAAVMTFAEFVRWCNSDGRVCQVFERGGFALVQPDTNVYPEQYTGRW